MYKQTYGVCASSAHLLLQGVYVLRVCTLLQRHLYAHSVLLPAVYVPWICVHVFMCTVSHRCFRRLYSLRYHAPRAPVETNSGANPIPLCSVNRSPDFPHANLQTHILTTDTPTPESEEQSVPDLYLLRLGLVLGPLQVRCAGRPAGVEAGVQLGQPVF
jgi:hypothetical protein